MGLLDFDYTPSERESLDLLRSRMNVAKAILGARSFLGMTQHELAIKAGTKQSRVSEVEALKGNLRFDTLDKIARVLGLMVILSPRQGPTDFELPPAMRFEDRSLRQMGAPTQTMAEMVG